MTRTRCDCIHPRTVDGPDPAARRCQWIGAMCATHCHGPARWVNPRGRLYCASHKDGVGDCSTAAGAASERYDAPAA